MNWIRNGIRTAAIALLLFCAASRIQAAATGQPNILWITCEDTSPNLGCYGDPDAKTPNLDAFAQKAVRYTRAFATAPVCAPARSALITGVYASSLGTENLRSAFPIPKDIKGFPAYLREAGYYCCNNVKTDYNIKDEAAFIREAWDESSARAHWRNRPEGKPFFSVFNLVETHQSRASVWSFDQFEKFIQTRLTAEERHDPAKVKVPPYYPDTPTVRRTLGRYHDCVTAMDKEVGRILWDLEEDGLAKDTIVFFFGDHGAGLPRGKRVLYDSGMQVPLLVRFPENFRRIAPVRPGRTLDRLVSFVDFGPTVLSLAGVEIPGHMQGGAFLGKSVAAPRDYVYGARGRVDEAFDLSRSVRSSRFLYIRNYMPHLSWMQPEGYSDQSDMRREMKKLASEGKLNPDQMTYAAPRRALEEFYDTETDPFQIHNLAESGKHSQVLQTMRSQLHQWEVQSRDVGFAPEAELATMSGTPYEIARDSKLFPQHDILEAAGFAGRPNIESKQVKLLSHDSSVVRFWAALGIDANEGLPGARARSALQRALDDGSASVRIEAAAALARAGEAEPAAKVLGNALQSKDHHVALKAARTLQLLGEDARPALPAMTKALQLAQDSNEQPADQNMRFALVPAVEVLKGKVAETPANPPRKKKRGK
jgi:arylsulfatase A-like enzyme